MRQVGNARAGLAPLAERTVWRVLDSGARRWPDRMAVRDPDAAYTYRELREAVLRFAGGYLRLGVSRQEPVVLMLDNHTDHALAWFGLGAIAAVEVPVNVAMRGPQLEHVIRDCGARVIVIEDCYAELLAAIELPDAVEWIVVRGSGPVPPLRGARLIGLDDFLAAEPAAPREPAPWDVCGVMYTSGTTGAAKGVMVSHAQTYWRMWPGGLGSPVEGDVTLVTLPIYHVIGQCRGLYDSLISGASVVILPRFSASGFWQSCRQYGATYAPLVGVMGSYLMRQPPSEGDRTHGVARITVGTTFAEVDEFRRRFGVEVYASYGMTETGGVLVGRAEPTGCGWPRPDVVARLVDEHDVDVAPGEAGELVLRPVDPWSFMLGYLNRPEATVEKWRNLWLHTGDVMRQREDGMFVFVDRRNDAVRRLGENVSTFEVEQQVLAHPSVAECAVVGVRPDPGQPGEPGESGEPEIKAVVVPADSQAFSEPELLAWLAGRLPHYAVPRYIEVMRELPRTPSTQRVTKSELVARGVEHAWDARAAGYTVTKNGLQPSQAAG